MFSPSTISPAIPDHALAMMARSAIRKDAAAFEALRSAATPEARAAAWAEWAAASEFIPGLLAAGRNSGRMRAFAGIFADDAQWVRVGAIRRQTAP